MAILLPTMKPRLNEKDHKKREEGGEKQRQCLISAVFILCPLWPLAHLHLHTGVFSNTGEPVGIYSFNIWLFLLMVKYSISGLFVLL